MIQHWTNYFDAINLPWEALETNKNAVTLPALAGAPVFRVCANQEELAKMHQIAKDKSAEMGRILILGLPFTAPNTTVTLPGEIVIPKVRAYGGRIADTFSLSGHKIENTLLTALKQETLLVISEGTKTKTPLLNWLLQLAGGSWVYGKPSSLAQLDSLLGLVCRDPNLIGHVRTRQLSFGRGCSDAMLLPVETVELKSHRLDAKVAHADWRLLSLESELGCKAKGRDRVLSYVSDRFLTTVYKHAPSHAQCLGAGQVLGGSVLGKLTKQETNVTAYESSVPANEAMAGI